VPVKIYNPSLNELELVSDNSSFIWQGTRVHNDIATSLYYLLGGYEPRDSPIPIVRESSLVECIIAGVVSSVGILSTIFFFLFNIYYRDHP